MDISLYYQIIDIGIMYEKGGKKGILWNIGERKRLKDEAIFWQNILNYISEEENGKDCSAQLFENLEKLCKNYKLPNYERVLEKKVELIDCNCAFEREKNEELRINYLMQRLLCDMRINLKNFKGKEIVYRILEVLHNLPKSMHGKNILCNSHNLISYKDALCYAKSYMSEEMKKEYKEYIL